MPQNPGGPPPTGVIIGTWQQEVDKYRAIISAKMLGVYNGNTPAQFKGMTFPQIYDEIINSKPPQQVNPYLAFKVVAQLWLAAKLAGVIIDITQATGRFTNTSEQGISRGISQFASPLQWLMSGQFWVRAGEVALGLVLVGVGLAKLAESNGLAEKIVSATPAGRLAKGLLK
jgi:hypothetical protein